MASKEVIDQRLLGRWFVVGIHIGDKGGPGRIVVPAKELLSRILPGCLQRFYQQTIERCGDEHREWRVGEDPMWLDRISLPPSSPHVNEQLINRRILQVVRRRVA